MHDRQDLRIGTKDEYEALLLWFLDAYPPSLSVYSSYTRMDGDEFRPGCVIETVWGFRDKDVAVMGTEIRGETYETRETLRYWVNEEILKKLAKE